jgi:hypothetical protein
MRTDKAESVVAKGPLQLVGSRHSNWSCTAPFRLGWLTTGVWRFLGHLISETVTFLDQRFAGHCPQAPSYDSTWEQTGRHACPGYDDREEAEVPSKAPKIVPLAAALAALTGVAIVVADSAEAKPTEPRDPRSTDAMLPTGLTPNRFMSVGEDLLGFTVTTAHDGTMIAQHVSHSSHSSHSSHYSSAL